MVVNRMDLETYASRSHDLTAILSFLTLEDLHVLTLSPRSISLINTKGLWERLLPATGIRHIEVIVPQGLMYADCFSSLGAAVCDHYGGHILFPQLRTLVLHLPERTLQCDSEIASAILHLLYTRKGLGAPLEEVRIVSKQLHAPQWGEVHSAVKVIQVDS